MSCVFVHKVLKARVVHTDYVYGVQAAWCSEGGKYYSQVLYEDSKQLSKTKTWNFINDHENYLLEAQKHATKIFPFF